MRPEDKADLIAVLKVGAITLPLSLIGGFLLWLLCWGRYWWPELTWLP